MARLFHDGGKRERTRSQSCCNAMAAKLTEQMRPQPINPVGQPVAKSQYYSLIFGLFIATEGQKPALRNTARTAGTGPWHGSPNNASLSHRDM